MTKTKHTIRVTQDHIDNGVPHQCKCCPVALALDEAFPGLIARVYNGYSVIFHPSPDPGAPSKRPARFDNPEIVQKFVDDFDHKKPVQPFEFEIEVKPA